MDLYEKLIFENEEKGFQYKLTVSEFREVQYLHVRKYFLSYEGEYVPIPPSGKSTVVISISPKSILITEKPKTPDSPTF